MTTRRKTEKAIIDLVNNHPMPFRWEASDFLMLHRANPMHILPNFYEGCWRRRTRMNLDDRFCDRLLALVLDKRTKFLIGIDGLYIWNSSLMEWADISSRSFEFYDIKMFNMKSQKIEFVTNLDRQVYARVNGLTRW